MTGKSDHSTSILENIDVDVDDDLEEDVDISASILSTPEVADHYQTRASSP